MLEGVTLSAVSSCPAEGRSSLSCPVRTRASGGGHPPARSFRLFRGPCRWQAGSRPRLLAVRHRHRRRTGSSCADRQRPDAVFHHVVVYLVAAVGDVQRELFDDFISVEDGLLHQGLGSALEEINLHPDRV